MKAASVKAVSVKEISVKRKCPNCRNRSLEFILGEWVCHECEYHSEKINKDVGKSFR